MMKQKILEAKLNHLNNYKNCLYLMMAEPECNERDERDIEAEIAELREEMAEVRAKLRTLKDAETNA